MPAISREDFLRNRPPVTKRVPVPEFGDGAEVIVRAMTERERSDIESSIAVDGGKRSRSRKESLRLINARIIVTAAVDESGNQLFTDADIPRILDLPASVTQTICAVAMKLAAIKEDDIEQLLDL